MESNTIPRRPQGFDGTPPASVSNVVRAELVAEARRLKAKRLRRERFFREYGTILVVSAVWLAFVAALSAVNILL